MPYTAVVRCLDIPLFFFTHFFFYFPEQKVRFTEQRADRAVHSCRSVGATNRRAETVTVDGGRRRAPSELLYTFRFPEFGIYTP